MFSQIEVLNKKFAVSSKLTANIHIIFNYQYNFLLIIRQYSQLRELDSDIRCGRSLFRRRARASH